MPSLFVTLESASNSLTFPARHSAVEQFAVAEYTVASVIREAFGQVTDGHFFKVNIHYDTIQ